MPYLSAKEVANVFLNGRKLQFNSKTNKGAESGWLPFKGSAETLLAMLAEDRCDFRIASRFNVGDFALVRSRGGVPRYAHAFSKHPGALYVRVLECYGDGTYEVTNGGFSQTVHGDDLNPVEE